jgi:hypothetical protein
MWVVPKLRNADGPIARHKKIFAFQEKGRTWEIMDDDRWLNQLSLPGNYSWL